MKTSIKGRTVHYLKHAGVGIYQKDSVNSVNSIQLTDTSRICFSRHEQGIKSRLDMITENALRSHCQPRLGAIVSWALKQIA